MTRTDPDRPYLEIAPDAILLVAADGTIVYANPRAREIFAVDSGPHDDLVGRGVEELVPPSLRSTHEHHRRGYLDAPSTRLMGEREARLIALRDDGSVFPCEIGLAQIASSGGADVTMAIVRDISARLAADQEARMIQSSLDAVDDALFLIDDTTYEFRYVNAGAARQSGRSRSELLSGLTLVDLLADLEPAELETALAPLRGGEIATTLTAAFARPDGTELPVELSLQHPSGAAAQDDRYFVAIGRDITDRRDAERLLRASEAGFRSAFTDAPVGMMIIAPDAAEGPTIIEANRAFCDLVGRDAAAVVGRTIADLTLADDSGEPAQISGWTGTADARIEKRFLHADGTAVWCREHISELRGTAGERRRLVHVIDISRRVQAEAARDRREEMLAALGEIRGHLLDELGATDALTQVCAVTGRLVGAPQTFVLLPVDSSYEVGATSGAEAVDYPHGELFDCGLADQVLHVGEVVLLDPTRAAVVDVPFDLQPGILVGAPLVTHSGREGVLVAAGIATGEEMQLRRTLEALAAEAAVAVQLARSRSERRRLSVIEDRERIARDLHDVVIQRLFATGMRLQSAAASGSNLKGRAIETVQELDETIGVIRETIFRLTNAEPDLYDEIVTVVHGFQSDEGRPVQMEIDGDITVVPETIAAHLLPTINELLSNAARHSRATNIRVEISIGTELEVTVSDDGCGFADTSARGFGLDNIEARARRLGGETKLQSSPGEGSTVSWRVPLTSVD